MRIIRLADLGPVPWRNGGGVTREIARADRDGALAWRLSTADVAADGPFSDFAGLVRILAVTVGAGLDLVGEAGAMAADLGRPLRFDGGLRVAACLRDGPVRDLNLMFDRRLCDGAMVLAEGPGARSMRGPALMRAVHALRGGVTVAGPLAPGDTALADGGEAIEVVLADEGAALLVTLSPPHTDAASEAIAAR